MTEPLFLSKDLRLPLAAVTERLGFLGRTGSGKTYAAQKLAEEMHRAGAQFIVLDPVGVWHGLRLAADGKGPGLPVPVLGGLHGDIPLEATGGALIANLVVDRGVSMVLDVSQFESDADKARFAQAFADRFFFRKKASPSAVHLFIEEAQEFVPQNPQREEARMLHAFTRLVKIGRNFGIGVSLISQRPQEVNKKVLNLTELLFCFQLTGPQERKTIQGWIAEKGIDEDIAAELPKLDVGQPHVWSPAWLKISERVRIAPKKTLDVSATPIVGQRTAARDLSPIDLEGLRKEMAATIERAKAEDPKALRAELAAVKAELARVKAAPSVKPVKETPALKDAQVKRLEYLTGRLEAILKQFDGWQSAFAARGQDVRAAATEISAAVQARNVPRNNITAPVPLRPATPRPIERGPAGIKTGRSRNGSSAHLPIGEARVLTAVAQYGEGVERDQLSVLTGYKRSSRDTYLQRLRERGACTIQGDRIMATAEGIGMLGPDFEPLPTGAALREYWIARLPEGERRILEALVRAHPRSVDREALDEATGYRRSSRDTYLQRLRSRRLVEDLGRGQVRASAELF